MSYWIDDYINDFAKQSKEIMKSGELLRKTSEQLNEIMLKEMKKILIKHLPK